MRKIALVLLVFLLGSSALFAAEWSNWQYLGEREGIELYVQYKFYSDNTKARFKVKNTTGNYFRTVSVVDKIYTCSDGSTHRKQDEGTTLKAYDEDIFISEFIDGHVTRVSCNMKIYH